MVELQLTPEQAEELAHMNGYKALTIRELMMDGLSWDEALAQIDEVANYD